MTAGVSPLELRKACARLDSQEASALWAVDALPGLYLLHSSRAGGWIAAISAVAVGDFASSWSAAELDAVAAWEFADALRRRPAPPLGGRAGVAVAAYCQLEEQVFATRRQALAALAVVARLAAEQRDG